MPGMTATNQQLEGSGSTAMRLLLAIVAAGLLISLAWWMTGPAPEAADAGLPASPPPMAVPVGMASTDPVALAIKSLGSGELTAARRSFVSLVAESPDDPVSQVGLILAGWRSVGPSSVERDLNQLAKEQPDSAYVGLHLGLVQVLLGASATSKATLRGVIEVGRSAGDATSLRMARLADDLLHPTVFRSYVPVLVQPADVPASDRVALGKLRVAIEREDRTAAGVQAKLLARSADGMARVAGIVGRYAKGDEQATIAPLARIAADASEPRRVRDRAVLHQALTQLWSGSDRDAGCALLARVAAAPADVGTRRLAAPISAELCR
jgi:hypothetical protein